MQGRLELKKLNRISMEKVYDHKNTEEKWYSFWEKKGYFKPEVSPKGKSYSIILPPPNANADLHFGHAMYTIEDILIRYHRMRGDSTLWLPGADHAGFETQVVFERHLAKEGKSRFDYDRDALYKMIWDFVHKNKGSMQTQLKRLGFSLDWSRFKFTLDSDIVKIVYKTFKKMYDEGLIYRDYRLVNYCTRHGTSFSDLEVTYEDRETPLYFIKYGPLTLATVRLETKFGDTAVAVHPGDKRYKKYVGKQINIETVLGPTKIKVVADEVVDPEFGTGVVKVTPAHSHTDFEIGKRHGLEIRQVINFDGKLNEKAGKFAGMSVKEARQAIAAEMQEKGLIEKVDDKYKNRVGVCYKCGTEIEPLPMEQWFVKIDSLAKKAIEVVKSGKVTIYPKNFSKVYFQWMENIRDWNISRQIVWGIQIPAWRCLNCNKWIVTEGPAPKKCPTCSDSKLQRDPEVFDTWFSSGQWPYAALQTTKKEDFKKFYPTSVMETGRDILFFWVARMIMMGIYSTGQVPFQDVVLHGTVLDPLGKKMSKSKNNVVDPMEIIDQYGADAARMALVYGTAFGHDQSLSHPKLQAMRNFTNKLWNIGRFVIDMKPEKVSGGANLTKEDNWILGELGKTRMLVTEALERYRFNDAAEELYEFVWHKFADKYIEHSKSKREDSQQILERVFEESLKLLHPFMPFITEELWNRLPSKSGDSIMVSRWPS